MLRRGRSAERAQVVPLVAIFMALVIVPLWALLIDSTAAEEAQHRAATAAFLAADSGSQVVEFVTTGPFTGSAQARLGSPAITECVATAQQEDAGAAVSCCITVVQGRTPPPGGNCAGPARYLHVVVERDVELPVGFFGWPRIHVSGSADGTASVGTVTPY